MRLFETWRDTPPHPITSVRKCRFCLARTGDKCAHGKEVNINRPFDRDYSCHLWDWNGGVYSAKEAEQQGRFIYYEWLNKQEFVK